MIYFWHGNAGWYVGYLRDEGEGGEVLIGPTETYAEILTDAMRRKLIG
ncbi:MAG TPA: hypothetical protein VLJ17_15225 [Xanthobacteraceae bacterium]|nr:hypothetical protein [Xanthobacteraceae bacterium]